MPPDPSDGGTSGDVDESLYSRQLYVMGHDAQVGIPRGFLDVMNLTCPCVSE